jgi:hypothetical protein
MVIPYTASWPYRTLGGWLRALFGAAVGLESSFNVVKAKNGQPFAQTG